VLGNKPSDTLSQGEKEVTGGEKKEERNGFSPSEIVGGYDERNILIS